VISNPGLYGKLPAHGDFVRRALPDSFVQPWDAWVQHGMAAARDALGEVFASTWEAAPAWRFLLPAGACGPDAAAGVFIPSEDLVGRRFPLILAALLPDSATAPDQDFFDALEHAGRAARQDAQDADTLLAALPIPGLAEAPPAPGWWRMEDGAVLRWEWPALPPPTHFRVLVEGGA